MQKKDRQILFSIQRCKRNIKTRRTSSFVILNDYLQRLSRD